MSKPRTRVLIAITLKKIGRGKYYYKFNEIEYEITNHGYYPPDKCIWWEAVNKQTGCADFHETTKKWLIDTMTRELTIEYNEKLKRTADK